MALTDSLISYWKMDEGSGDALDAHGANTLSDNATVGTGTGIINGARDFELDNGEFFSRADNASLSLGSDTDFTISAWINIEDNTFSNPIVCKRYGTFSNEETEYLLSANVSTKPRLVVGSGASFQFVDWGASLSTATWYFIVAWHDSTADKIFIQINNGTPVEAIWAGGTQDGNGDFLLGGLAGSSVTFDGLIDEAGFWKRVLTSQERTDLYNGGAGLPYSSFGGATLMGQILT